jgi:hypothetical protein
MAEDNDPLASPWQPPQRTAINYLARRQQPADPKKNTVERFDDDTKDGKGKGYSFTGMIKLVRDESDTNSEPLCAGEEYYVNDLGDMAGGDPARDYWKYGITKDEVPTTATNRIAMTAVRVDDLASNSFFEKLFPAVMKGEMILAWEALDSTNRVNPYYDRDPPLEAEAL